MSSPFPSTVVLSLHITRRQLVLLHSKPKAVNFSCTLSKDTAEHTSPNGNLHPVVIHRGVVFGKALKVFLFVGLAPPTSKSALIVLLTGIEPDIDEPLFFIKLNGDRVLVPEGTNLQGGAIPILNVDACDTAVVTVEFHYLNGEGMLSNKQEGIASCAPNAKVSSPDALINESQMVLHC